MNPQETIRYPKWTIAGNYKSPSAWIGTFWEFFDEKETADRQYNLHKSLGICCIMRPFHYTDVEHLAIEQQLEIKQKERKQGNDLTTMDKSYENAIIAPSTNNQFYLKCKILNDTATILLRKYNSAGYDLFPCEDGVIYSKNIKNIPLGFATEFSSGYVAIIDDRGSTGSKGLTHLAGVIDADFRGEWVLWIVNLGQVAYHYSKERAIAQVLFIKVEEPVIEIVEELSKTIRGDKSLGSSDQI